MSRHLISLYTEEDRKRARTYVNSAPLGTRVEFKAAKRSLPQNDALWSYLTDIAAQKTHNGRRYTPEIWKALFLHGLQREVQLIPTLDGSGLLPLTRTSDLSKQEFSDLLEFIKMWAAENGVVLHGEQVAA